MPRARAVALVGLCRALADGDLRLERDVDRAQARRRLLALPGIGPWTAGYVAMRALGDPDVFLVEGPRRAPRVAPPRRARRPARRPRPRRGLGAVALVRLAAPVAGAGGAGGGLGMIRA
jgi:AraC family transcriptional regulator of adaptative response / DNA-3-methyladenine glycosylase II